MPGTTPSDEKARREDFPDAGMFNRHGDAVAEADRRADLTGYRYAVRYDAANRWWYLSETTQHFRPAESDD